MSLYDYMQPNGLLSLQKPIKRKVFISYHHKNDQMYYDLFSKWFSDFLNLFHDNSVERGLDSNNSEYLNRKIREEYIFGTSLTIVLCGAETWKRRWVDWEIHATLHYQHGLLGIILPTCSINQQNQFLVPDRLVDNVGSGYATWMKLTQDDKMLKSNMETTIKASNSKLLIRNSATKMKRSHS